MPQKPDPSWNYATARQTRNSNAHKTQDVRYTHTQKKKVIALNQHVPLSLSLFTVVSLCLVQHHDIWVIEIVHCIYTHYYKSTMLYLFLKNRKTTHQIMLKTVQILFVLSHLAVISNSFFRHVLLELGSLIRNFLSCIFWHDKKKHFIIHSMRLKTNKIKKKQFYKLVTSSLFFSCVFISPVKSWSIVFPNSSHGTQNKCISYFLKTDKY